MLSKNAFIGLCIGVAVLAAGFFAWKYITKPVVRNYPSTKAGPIVAFGDSLVTGYGSSDGNDFVSLLSKKIGEPIENLGVPGDTTDDALARVNDAVARGPRIALVLLGGNDFLKKTPHATTFANLKTIIGRFQASGAIVLLLGVPDGIFFDDARLGFNNLASDTGSAYVPDVLEGLFGDGRYMSDEVHPNDAGYARIADKVFPVLAGLLR